jgi:hypothetical protein
MKLILFHIFFANGIDVIAKNNAKAAAIMNELFFPIFVLFVFMIAPIYFRDTLYTFIL